MTFLKKCCIHFKRIGTNKGIPYNRSALFYILNRCSSLHETSRGEIDKNRLNRFLVSRFKKIQLDNFYVLLDKSEDANISTNNEIRSDFKFFPVGDYNLKLLEGRDHGTIEMSPVSHIKLRSELNAANYRWGDSL